MFIFFTILKKIIDDVDNIPISRTFFYKLANGAKSHSSDKKIFDFKSISECAYFLIQIFIKQGGRCAYSNVPIYPISGHKYMMSIERKNPLNGYTKENIILIVAGLNCPPSGQIHNKNRDEIEKEEILKTSIFNQEYWDKCTLLTIERRIICEKIRMIERNLLSSLIKD